MMKNKKSLLAFVLSSVLIIGCTAGGANETGNSAETNENANIEATTESALESSNIAADTESTPESANISVDTESALLNGDFSYFAGTYMPCSIYDEWYGGGEKLPNLLLEENGIVTGGLVYGSYSETKPTTVTRNEDGSYLCQVSYSSDASQEYFVIYPTGVIGENPYIYNDPFLTETAYIQYFSIDGGVSDIIYYKIED
jgi:hypothetical protein